MTRDEIYNQCVEKISKTNCLLLEAATGLGKSKISIDLINHLINSKWYKDRKEIKILLLVAKIVHKQTWKDEIAKWGGINHPTATINLCMECYESLHKHTKEYWDIIILDEVHHVGSDARLDNLSTIKYGYMIGLSATIPFNTKQYFKFNYHAQIVSCDITEAIDSEVLPEPTILLFPLQLENTKVSEVLELHTNAPGPVVYCDYKDLYKYKFKNIHVCCKCTQQQKLNELNRTIEWFKSKAMGDSRKKQTWQHFCGKRLEYLADCKIQWVKLILHHLSKERTITFCKTIPQTELLGKNCIHSKNKQATQIYNDFNAKKIDHITAVNILNENANLVDCKYAVFCNISSSEVVIPQRLGRAMRHKSPVIVMPYYKNTREQEIIEKMFKDFNKDFIKTIHSIKEI